MPALMGSIFILVVNFLSGARNSLYDGLCLFFPVPGLSLDLWNGWNFILRLYVSPLWTRHTFFCHFDTSMRWFG